MCSRIILICITLLIAACDKALAPEPPSPDKVSIVGRWTMPDTAVSPPALACVSYVEFYSDGRMSSRAGEAVITGNYELVNEEGKLFLYQRNLIGNDKKNCQGLESEVIVRNTIPKARVEIIGDYLKTYMNGKENKYFLLVRSNQ